MRDALEILLRLVFDLIAQISLISDVIRRSFDQLTCSAPSITNLSSSLILAPEANKTLIAPLADESNNTLLPPLTDHSARYQLPAELLAIIISHLRVPLPKPNGRSTHSAIRQTDLAVLMRTSKLFNNLTARVLYSTVVADNLSLLAYNLDTPSSSTEIPSKDELLAYIRRLYLEYPPIRDPTYVQCMQDGPAAFIRINPDGLTKASVRHGEAIDMAAAANRLVESSSLSLLSVSYATLLGQQGYTDLIQFYNTPGSAFTDSVNAGRWAVSRFFMEQKNVRSSPSYFCTRIGFGPLAGITIFQQKGVDNPVTQSTHFHLPATSSPGPVFLGGHTDYYMTSDIGDHPRHDRPRDFEEISGIVRHSLEMRYSARADLGHPVGHSSLSMSIDIWVPARWHDHPYWPHTQADFANAIIAACEVTGLTGAFNPNDSFRIRKLEDAPPCLACGWTTDDI